MSIQYNQQLVDEDFYQSKRIFSLVFISMLKKEGVHHTRRELNNIFKESTYLLFSETLTVKNLEATIMNFEPEELEFNY